MDESYFASIFETERKQIPRTERRVVLSVPVLIEMRGRYFHANLIDISVTVLRIDQKFSISSQDRCRVMLKTGVPLELICLPIISEKEFQNGTWCRMKIISKFSLDDVVPALPADAS